MEFPGNLIPEERERLEQRVERILERGFAGFPAPPKKSRLLEPLHARRRWLQAAAILLLILAGGAVAAKGLEWYQRFQRWYTAYHFDAPIVYHGDDREKPPESGKAAKPISTVGHQVRIRGEAWPHLIRQIEIAVTPGLDKGESVWRKVLAISSDADDASRPPKSFRLSFEVPGDGQLRTVTIRPIPHPEALAANPDALREEKLICKVNVLCLGLGAIAYVDDLYRLENLQPGQNILEPLILVKGTAREDGFLAIVVEDPEGNFHLQNQPIAVKAGQPFGPVGVHFGRPEGGRNEFVVHFAHYKAPRTWPADLGVGQLVGGLPVSASPGEQIQYLSVRVNLKQ